MRILLHSLLGETGLQRVIVIQSTIILIKHGHLPMQRHSRTVDLHILHHRIIVVLVKIVLVLRNVRRIRRTVMVPMSTTQMEIQIQRMMVIVLRMRLRPRSEISKPKDRSLKKIRERQMTS